MLGADEASRIEGKGKGRMGIERARPIQPGRACARASCPAPSWAMTFALEDELASLTTLAANLVDRAKKRGADVAEVIARSGSELSTTVRLGEPELVTESVHRGVGMRIIKSHRVALTSTSDLRRTDWINL